MESVEERKKKFLVVAPLIVIPFLALLFYSLGGGRANPLAAKTDTTHGLNDELPAPQLASDGGMDKLSLYRKEEKEHQDSILHHQGRSDTVFIPSVESDGVVESPFSPGPITDPAKGRGATSSAGGPVLATGYQPSKEQQLTQKIAALQQLLAKHAADTLALPPAVQPAGDTAAENRIAALEARLQQQTPEAAIDPGSGSADLTKMDGVLEKVLDIKYPERVQERLRQASMEQKGKVLAVAAQPTPMVSDLLGPAPSATHLPTPTAAVTGDFFELDDDQATAATTNTIAAVIHEGRTVTSGATVKIRLQQDIYVKGQLIPRGNFVFGKCSFSGDRMLITVSSITYQGNVYPVSLTVYDTGGMVGISIDASLNQDAAKEGSDQAIQALSVGTMDPSLGAQAASAGIEAAKHMLSKKAKTIKVTLKADTPILLVDSKNLN
ncbi:conjugative transposon protein TraM [Chitinophaga parva]|nr:conjugative transposon protein TraM [Chitinophaga parva]